MIKYQLEKRIKSTAAGYDKKPNHNIKSFCEKEVAHGSNFISDKERFGMGCG